MVAGRCFRDRAPAILKSQQGSGDGSEMVKPLKFGVVGVGTVSIRGLIPHLVQDDIRDRVLLTALCDPVVDRVETAPS